MLALPRRTWTDESAAEMARQLTALLRTPNGRMDLRPIQAVALAEAGAYGGLWAPIRVGGGKTLLSLLLPVVMELRRPLLLVPANLVAKTKAAMSILVHHWQIPARDIRIESFEWLGQPQAADMLEQYRPDGGIVDEAHRLKNLKGAAVAKRVVKYAITYPSKWSFLTGSATKRSPCDYGHLLALALRAGAPVPRGPELENWAGALGERTDGSDPPVGLGALLDFCSAEERATLAPLDAARRAYRRRLVDTPGVVASADGAFDGATLRLSTLSPKLNKETRDALVLLRGDGTSANPGRWELPTGETFMEGPRVWAAARQLSLGFFYRWDPPPPPEWMEARREWYAVARHILTSNRRGLDSPRLVRDAVDAGLYPAATDLLARWRAIEPTFTPNTVPVWLDDGPLEAAARWARKGPGIVWTEHTAFARRLAQATGLPYYGREGRDEQGRHIPEFDTNPTECGRDAIIASIANRTGRNLQGWSRALVVSPPPNGEWWEQLLGRQHRDGTRAAEVTYEIFVTSQEHREAIEQAERDAKYIEATLGQAQKLIYADKDW